MKIQFIIIVLILSSGNCNSQNSENEKLQQEIIELKRKIKEIQYREDHSQVFLSNTELKDFSSSINGQTYKIKVKLPKDYDSETNSYPVLYVTDAETNFGGISYIVQRLIKDKLIPPMIIVGIAYGTDYKSFYKLRSRDLTPVVDRSMRIDPTGGAPEFCDFLSKELFPFIEETYRVKKNERTLYGHSYGGLFGTYVLLNKPEMFRKYLLLGPSLWYYDNLMLTQIENVSPKFDSTRLYMASGELEKRIDDLQNIFIDKLKKKNFSNLSFKAEVMKNETHRTIFGAGFTNGMRYLFDK